MENELFMTVVAWLGMSLALLVVVSLIVLACLIWASHFIINEKEDADRYYDYF